MAKRKREREDRQTGKQQASRISLQQFLLIGILAVPVAFGLIYAWEIRSADAFLRRGMDCLQSGHSRQSDKAVLCLQQAIGKDGANKTALYYLTAAFREGGNPVKAAETYERLLRRDPNFMQARFHLGLLLLGQREFAGAAEHFAAHVRTNNMYWQSYYGLGYCLSELKKPGEAIAALEEIDMIHQIQNLPADKYLEVKKLAYVIQRDAGNREGAARTLETIRKIRPSG